MALVCVLDRHSGNLARLAQEDDVLAHLAFPKEHWPQLHSTNPSND